MPALQHTIHAPQQLLSVDASDATADPANVSLDPGTCGAGARDKQELQAAGDGADQRQRCDACLRHTARRKVRHQHQRIDVPDT